MSGQTSVTILGATGSVGRSAVSVLRENRSRYRVEAVVGGRDAAALARLAKEVGAAAAAVCDEAAYPALKAQLAGTGIAALGGEQGVLEAAARPSDRVVAAISGVAGLAPTCVALGRGAIVALANKEAMVSAGAAVMATAQRGKATILPLDSEHNALFQALGGASFDRIERLVLTASGGPFRTWPREKMLNATPEQAVAHPNFSMGAKISVDSATMMNKGLELIEASVLFSVPEERIDVVVHPQQIVHGLVGFRDGSMNAGLCLPDMRVPMAHCLAWPERIGSGVAALDLLAVGRLDFEAPDLVRFPALRLAREALKAGGTAPTVLNAANEVAVAAFLAREIAFGDIVPIVEVVMNSPGLADQKAPGTVEAAVFVDHVSRLRAREALSRARLRETC